MTSGVPFDEADRQMFLAAVAEGHHPRTAAEEIGFTWATVKRHLDGDANFAAEMVDAQDRATAVVEDVLYDAAKDGHLGAIKMWLYNRRGDRWRDEQVLRKEITGAGGGPIMVVQANVQALREVLTDADTREGALALVSAIPAGSHELPAGEDGESSAPRGHGDRASGP